MRTVCVYCGSRFGSTPKYVEGAKALALEMVARNLRLVYGGASIGTMGVVADTMLQAGGEVVGVIPKLLLDKEIAHLGLSDLKVVTSMHERKALMAELSDAFVALPGGLGTFEELLETLTWCVLGIHAKPCGILNLEGYYDGLSSFLAHAVKQQFVEERHLSMLLVDGSAPSLLDKLQSSCRKSKIATNRTFYEET